MLLAEISCCVRIVLVTMSVQCHMSMWYQTLPTPVANTATQSLPFISRGPKSPVSRRSVGCSWNCSVPEIHKSGFR